jgi:hypothetical protein
MPEEILTRENLHARKKKWSSGIPIFVLANGKFRPKDYNEEA